MCFFYKKKLLKQQQELLSLHRELLEQSRGLEQERKHDREVILSNLKTGNEVLAGSISTNNETLFKGLFSTNDAVLNSVKEITGMTDKRVGEIKEDLMRSLTDIRGNMEKTLKEVRQDNEKQLGEIKSVVDEKLTRTLDERISKSFNAIGERLDAVNKGFGEMQSLTTNVTDLRKVLTNVKTRGVFGEVSLGNILTDILTAGQYKEQFAVRKNSSEKVDFAIELPGKGEPVYLPMDAKFPLEDYQRIAEYSEAGDLNGMSEASKSLEKAIKLQAKNISEKYIIPPFTVDFAIMYLPIEGLYAEVVKNPGLVEELRNKYKVIPAGPTTVTALINSLQLGFRTLAIQKSSKDVFDLLEKFQSDFRLFVGNIEKAQNQVQSAGKTLDKAEERTRIIMKKLNKIERLSPPEEEDLTEFVLGSEE